MEGVVLANEDGVRASVSKYYGETLQTSSDLKTSACCTAKAPPKEVLDVMKQLPQEIISKYYGCGSPFPRGLKDSGLRVLDLGCGSGRDCYVCAALVGGKGFVTGIDMTPAQLDIAKKHSQEWQQQLGYQQPNMRFIQGAIEHLDTAGLEPNSVDLAISNCVINLSPDKAAVLQQVHTVLAPGGEMFFSDVYCDKRLPAEVRSHEVLLGECLGGALAVDDFVQLAKKAGFADALVLEAESITVHDSGLKALLGDARFYSITFRLFKVATDAAAAAAAAEPPSTTAAAPSKIVTYQGTLSGAADTYELDYQHTFTTGVPVLVTDKIAAICSSSWLSPHFKVANSSSCCAPKPQATLHSTHVTTSSIEELIRTKSSSSNGSSGGGCCAPAPAASSGCCPSNGTAAAAAAATGGSGGGCCGPKTAPVGNGGAKCCPPPAAAAAATDGGSGGGCCAKPNGKSGCC